MSAVLGVLVAGGIAYYCLVVVAALRAPPSGATTVREGSPRITLLKPLAGAEPSLERNLRSFFDLDYPNFEVIFGVRDHSDLARPIAEALSDERTQLLITGEPPPQRYPNPKVYQLIAMAERATGEILVISDSDILVAPDLLDAIAADFADPRVGVVTYPYRAISAGGPWSLTEAIGMDTEFWGGVLVAQMLAPMGFAVGPTMAMRRSCLEELGGFEAFREYAAEDFEIGRLARQAGWEVTLSRHVVEHHIGSQGLLKNFGHRVRWSRQTRRSRPLGYVGQVFTYPLPFALGLSGWSWWPLISVLALRFAAAAAVLRVLQAQWGLLRWSLLLPQDLASFLTWILGFFGKRLNWRGREYELTPDGRLRLK